MTILAIVILVPFIEELLFRGFLQSFLKRYVERKWAIVITAALFAIVHFAPSQKEGNVQLIGALFILACFLGFAYEKEGTLWAPIGLHVAFNGASVLMIAFGS
jgi:membrane protease YdiL (CAAX protease family)